MITQYMIEDAISGEIHVLADNESKPVLEEIVRQSSLILGDMEIQRDNALENYSNLEEELEAAKGCLADVQHVLDTKWNEESLPYLVDLLTEWKRNWR